MLIVFDLEATCWATKEEQASNTSEIIQIGAAKLSLAKGEITDTFECLVRPKHSKELSDYCTELTGITTDQVRSAEYFEQVYPKFVRFCGSRYKHTLIAWGAYDGKEIENACQAHNLELKHPRHYINASLLFKEKHGLPKKIGLHRAVEHCGFEFEGTQHNALHDALNTAKVFAYTMGVVLNA